MNERTITQVTGREILDSRGNPTVEAEVTLADGAVGRGCAPSGASTGEFEALELRDGDRDRYLGRGVTGAVEHINTVIARAVAGMDAADLYAVDAALLAADGTQDKSHLGANAVHAGQHLGTIISQGNLYQLFHGEGGNQPLGNLHAAEGDAQGIE